MIDLIQLFNIALLVFGFGFVIFFHELGHFLAAKWAGVRVDQFAVGFGQALLSWRKGLGLRFGGSTKEFEARVAAGTGAEISETEYRLNWIPLGGYVKMMGQDDMNPNAESADPRAYNRKSIGKRMVIVSAGVVMNIILAAVGFTIVFLIGLKAPPAIVGGTIPGSPAALAGVKTGERVLMIDGATMHDFTKIQLNIALSEEGTPIPVTLQALDGSTRTLQIAPRRADPDPRAFLALGILPPTALSSKPSPELTEMFDTPGVLPDDRRAVAPNDTILAVNGTDVSVTATEPAEVVRQTARGLAVLDQALQASQGKSVELTVKRASGAIETTSVEPRFQMPFGVREFNIAGMMPRVEVDMVSKISPALNKLLPGDVIDEIAFPKSADLKQNLSMVDIQTHINAAGAAGTALDFTVERNGVRTVVPDVIPSLKIDTDRDIYGLGISLQIDTGKPVVANLVKDSPASVAGITAGSIIVSIGGQPVATWHDVKRLLNDVAPGVSVPIVTRNGDEVVTHALSFTPDQIASVKGLTYTHSLYLGEVNELRRTGNPAIAAWWGVTETRDFTLQFYLTLKRMIQGSVSYKNMMGPVGIFHAGTKFAYKGTDWLIWFLAMISANLAVVNFLPIPIVDGGLFTFLIIEKLRGKPLSARAQGVFQIIGLALILSIFVLVTYQDITRFF